MIASLSILILAACSSPVDEQGIATRLAAHAAMTPVHPSPIGTNLAPVVDWGTERPFADLMKQSRAWISNTETNWDDHRTVEVDARGWPKRLLRGQRARTLLIWDAPVPKGDYVVTWKGRGTLDFWPQDADVDDHRAVIHADPTKEGLALTITSTDERDPVRDIHVFPKGLEGAQFHPDFLKSLAGYSTLRFMDWLETNDAKVKSFAERAVVDDARYTVKGVPLELVIDLCNTLGVDMWLTVPDTWDDDANTKAAKLVHDRLRPAQQVYVEHSNEVWNDIFPQSKRAEAEGVRRGLGRDPFEARIRRHAARSVEIFAIWERAFKDKPARLVRTLGSMAPTPSVSETLLAESDVAAHTDALAIAPYFGGDVHSGASVQSVIEALDRAVDDVDRNVRAHKKIADRFHVRLIAYEGGQHLVTTDPRADAVFTQANRDPRMKALYLKALARWKDAGGGLFVHFQDTSTPSKFGRWGARERIDQPRTEAPKLDALMTFAETTPRWW